MSNRTLLPILCKKLQPLTQNSVITASDAGVITQQFIVGNTDPLKRLVESKDIPVCYLPIVREINEVFLKGGELC